MRYVIRLVDSTLHLCMVAPNGPITIDVSAYPHEIVVLDMAVRWKAWIYKSLDFVNFDEIPGLIAARNLLLALQ